MLEKDMAFQLSRASKEIAVDWSLVNKKNGYL